MTNARHMVRYSTTHYWPRYRSLCYFCADPDDHLLLPIAQPRTYTRARQLSPIASATTIQRTCPHLAVFAMMTALQEQIMEAKIIAAIVSYHPDDKIFKNIDAIVPQVDGVIIIDNTETESDWCLRIDSTLVHYVHAGENLGIATALNIALSYAVNVGAAWMLTLDQDSVVASDYVVKLCESIRQNNSAHAEVVSIGGVPIDPENGYRLITALPGMPAPHLITSGNLIRIDALSAVGGYRSELFIDYVDLWLSMTLCSRGYRVLQCENAIFEHSLGASSHRSLFGKRLRLSNHSAMRRYYITRNRFLFWCEALSNGRQYLRAELRQFVIDCIALSLEKQRCRKLRAMGLALFDAVVGKRGKCSYNL